MKYYEFINPYHFMPLGEKCNRPEEKEHESEKKESVYSGYLTVELKNRTKMLVPRGRRREDRNNDETLEFFTYSDETGAYKKYPPVIPGSSLRGMLRSVYEMATDSCLSALDTSKPIYRRISDPGKPALLHKTENGMKLCMDIQVERERINSPLDRSYKECEYVEDGGSPFIYLKGEDFRRKKNHYRFILPKGAQNTGLNVTEQMLEQFEKTLSVYQDKAINKTSGHNGYREYARIYNRFKLGKLPDAGYSHDYFPVYCHEVRSGGQSTYYITPAAISKEMFRTSLEEILERSGGYQPCTSVNRLCPACSLFGMVGKGDENGTEALKGRVRITDAVFMDDTVKLEDHYEKEHTLEELSTPRLSSLEFYLKRPEGAVSWTPDYYVKENGQIVWNDQPEIMGRKFYWHHQEERLPEVEKTVRNARVRLLKENRHFQYKIYFEGLAERQIRQLIFLCNLSEFDCEGGKAKYGFRLGMGKPLGLGSCESHVTEARIRRWTDEEGGKLKIAPFFADFSELFEENWHGMSYEASGFSANKENFLLMTAFDAVGDTPVSYPLSHKQSVEIMEKGYEFYTGNRYGKKRDLYSNSAILKRKDVMFQQNLEPLDGEVPKLHVNGRCQTEKDRVRDVVFALGEFYAIDSSENLMSETEAGRRQEPITGTRSEPEKESRKKASGQKGSGNLQVGDIVCGNVTGVQGYGAFVKLDTGESGLIHISQIGNERILNVGDVLHMGDRVEVKVIGIKDGGKLELSRKALL